MSDSDWVPYHQRDRLSIPHLLAISANTLTCSLIWTPIGYLVNPMCKIFKLNAVYTTLIILIGPIAGLIVPPYIAALSDRCTLKWGRRRLFIVIGEIGSVVGLLFLSFCDVISKSHGVQVTFLVLGQLIVSVFGNVMNGPGWTMSSDLAPESQQVLVSNLRQVHSALAGLISNLVGALKLYEKVGMKNAQFVLLISCIVGFVALVISIIASHEEQLVNPPEQENKGTFKTMIEAFGYYDLPLWLVALSFFFFQMGANQYGTQIAEFMGKVVFGGDPGADENSAEYKAYDSGLSHSQTLNIITTVIQFAFSFASTHVTKFITLKGTWAFGMLSGCLAQFLFFFKMNKWVYIISAIFWSFDQVVGNSVPYTAVSLYADKEKLSSLLTIVIFMGNVAGFLCNFIFTMGLGSVQWFIDNPGRLIALPFIFTLTGAILGFIGIRIIEKKLAENLDDSNQEDGEKEDVDDSKMI